MAWKPLGWSAVAFAEIEPFPCAVLAHHYPDVPNWGDMTKYQEWPDADFDVLCGGTPCQSFSVAGLRGGLDDARGNLMLTFAAIARRYRPARLVWENVPGVLSSNGGTDFASLLGLLSGRAITCPVDGWRNSGVVPGIARGYGLAWRVLDAQYFGVAQRRRRVFLVGYLGDWRRAAAVLFERHSLSGHPAPSRQAREGTAAGAARSLAIRGRDGVPQAELGDEVANALVTPSGGRGGIGVGAVLTGVGMCLNAKGGGGRLDAESETLIPTFGGGFDVAHALTGEGFDASENGTGRGTPLVPVAYAATDYESGAFDEVEQAAPLTTSADRTRAAPILAFSAKDHGADAMQECSPTLRAGGHSSSHANAGVMPAIAYGADCFNGLMTGEVAATMGTRGSSETASGPTLLQSMQVRRLTPRECERLQGFPDDYTLVPHNGKPAADGPRYKAIGNSWAVPCARWIGERINQVEALTSLTAKGF